MRDEHRQGKARDQNPRPGPAAEKRANRRHGCGAVGSAQMACAGISSGMCRGICGFLWLLVQPLQKARPGTGTLTEHVEHSLDWGGGFCVAIVAAADADAMAGT